jgi:hypothetical protein
MFGSVETEQAIQHVVVGRARKKLSRTYVAGGESGKTQNGMDKIGQYTTGHIFLVPNWTLNNILAKKNSGLFLHFHSLLSFNLIDMYS